MEMEGPHPAYHTDGKMLAAKQYYIEEFNGTDAPVPEKGSYVRIAS
jgi:hypothetical protein